YGSHDHLFRNLNTQKSLYDDSDALPQGDVMRVIAEDPYLLREVRGIGFKRADVVALENFGIDKDDERRHIAGNQAVISGLGAMPMWKYRKARERLELHNREHELAGVTVDHDLVW